MDPQCYNLLYIQDHFSLAQGSLNTNKNRLENYRALAKTLLKSHSLCYKVHFFLVLYKQTPANENCLDISWINKIIFHTSLKVRFCSSKKLIATEKPSSQSIYRQANSMVENQKKKIIRTKTLLEIGACRTFCRAYLFLVTMF